MIEYNNFRIIGKPGCYSVFYRCNGGGWGYVGQTNTLRGALEAVGYGK